MKTAKQITENFPRPGRFSLYMCAVMVLCFFNWVVLNAQPAISLAEVDEPELKLEEWMMDLDKGYLAINEDAELKVEPWMLSFNQDYLAGADESAISFEPWMVNFEQRCLVVESEQEFSVEGWMVSTCTWECAARLLARK